jgi:hypothetical protein
VTQRRSSCVRRKDGGDEPITLALGLFGLGLGAMFVWGVDYRLAGVELDFVGVSMITFGTLALLSETVAYARRRIDGAERSRRQAGTSL